LRLKHFSLGVSPVVEWSYGRGTAGDLLKYVAQSLNKKDSFYMAFYKRLEDLEERVKDSIFACVVSTFKLPKISTEFSSL
jgi:hypothetical protein